MSERLLLCFGDSNTAGQEGMIGDEATFHPKQIQWPNIVQEELDTLTVLQSGRPGRFAGELGDDPALHGHAGFAAELDDIDDLGSVEYVVVALGINDLQKRFESSAEQLKRDLGEYAVYVAGREALNAEVIFIGIPNYTESTYMLPNAERRDMVNDYLKSTFHYIHADDIEHGPDGVHYSVSDHNKIANRVIEYIRQLEKEKEV